MSVHLEPASPKDSPVIFQWRNDPWIVALSASQRGVSWEEHRRWFGEVLNQDKHLLLIARSDDEKGMGCVRFDRVVESTATVSIYLLQAFVGKGLGPILLTCACDLAFQHWPAIDLIRAYIRSDNSRSIRAFTKAGFIVEHSTAVYDGVEMVLFRR